MSILCRLCGEPTEMTGTKLCDRCWELEHRVLANPTLALKILMDNNLVSIKRCSPLMKID